MADWWGRAGQIGVRDALRTWRTRVWRYVGVAWQRMGEWADASVWFAALLGAVGATGWLVASRASGALGETWQGVFIEAAGAVMDLVVFGVVIGVVVVRRDRWREVRSHQEQIDDYKKWDSEEARHRIAGAVRRLNRLGRTAIDFVGMETSRFSFRAHDIDSIAGSAFYAGAWGTAGSREKAVLREVDFSFVDCRDVVFSAYHPLGGLGMDLPRHAQFRDCQFVGADLRGATFKGALLEWTEKPPLETGYGEETPEGVPAWIQEYYPPFYGADLSGTSFEDAAFRNADFRHAENLDKCKFAGATGLEYCKFDSEEDRERVLRLVRKPAS